jgi:hypothetical protein
MATAMRRDFPSSKETYKLDVPLRVVYRHLGSALDFPIRLVACGGSPLRSCGGGIDVLLEPSEGGGGNGAVAVDALASLTFEGSREGPILSCDPVLIFNVCCSVENHYGRRCWRNGGTCHVSLTELLGNARLSEAGGASEGVRPGPVYSFRHVYVSGYGVPDGERLTGVLAVRACGLDAFGAAEPSRWRVTCEATPCARLYARSPPSAADPPRADAGELLRRLFGVRLENPVEPSRAEGDPILPLGRYLETATRARASSRRTTQRGNRSEFASSAREAFEEYERVLRRQLALVPICDRRTRNMKCPWTPADGCVWELQPEYEGRYLATRPDPVGGRDLAVAPSAAASCDRRSVNWEHCVRHAFRADGEAVAAVGAKRGGDGASPPPLAGDDGVFEAFGSAKMEALDRGSPERVYLPYFSYLMCSPPRVYRGFWTGALTVLASREGYGDVGDFERHFLSECRPGRRASLAFQMLCGYVQGMEYVPDYYIPRRGTSSSTTTSGRGKTRRIEDQKEIEQFWNALRAICGDCDDLALGHLSVYRAFVEDSWTDERGDAEISANATLKEMRRVLASNYLAMLNIEGVYLPRQQARSDPTRSSRPPEENRSAIDPTRGGEGGSGSYAEDTEGMNSAHAAVKLIPKLYFERCVNRSAEATGSPPPFPSTSGSGVSLPCCFYHAHAPDPFNDELPLLFGEGTSMLRCSDDEKDPCEDSWISDALGRDEMLNDALKCTIWPEKGRSNFYKATLFGSTLSFLENHGVSTFTYARRCEGRGCEAGKKGRHLTRGATHRQLSHKSEAVVLVPYGSLPTAPPRPSKAGDAPPRRRTARSSRCGVTFSGREVSEGMYELCAAEATRRVCPRKIGRPSPRPSDPSRAARGGSRTYCRPYDASSSDAGRTTGDSEATLRAWCAAMNETWHDASRPLSTSNVYRVYLDGYYVTREVLEAVSEAIRVASEEEGEEDGEERGVPPVSLWETMKGLSSSVATGFAGPSGRPRGRSFRTTFRLDEFSSDVKIWRIEFAFPKGP